jgi:hypothetical protein
MKTLKILIVVLLVLSLGILFGVGYVWKQVAFVSTENSLPTSNIEVNATITASPSASRTQAGVLLPPLLSKPITVSTENLPASQQKVLDTLGIGTQSITVTPKAVECAVTALGSVRALELKEGGTPTIAEGLTLLACLKK